MTLDKNIIYKLEIKNRIQDEMNEFKANEITVSELLNKIAHLFNGSVEHAIEVIKREAESK